MEFTRTEIPYDFLVKIVKPTWIDIKEGIIRKVFSTDVAIEHAMAELGKLDEYPDALVELASLNKGDDIHPYIDELSDLNKVSLDLEGKYLFIVLAWLYENKDNLDDPLAVVEEVYADFDYPAKISEFVRYMPSDEPDLGNVEKNCARLIDKWNCYLEEQYKVYNQPTTMAE